MDETLTDTPLIRDNEIFLRMNLIERIQHILLIVTFSLLILTGLPVLFYELKFLRSLFAFEKAFYLRGMVHRAAAVLLIADIVWHILYTVFTRRGRANFKEIMPKFKDARDAWQLFWHNVGLTNFLYKHGIFKNFFRKHPPLLFEKEPEFGRYNFIEKFEYLAVAWGSFIMIISGFFMWKVELSLSLFPLWVHDIFVIVHGYEAMLAFLSIIIWHMYNVHLNPEVFPMSKIWLNGKITGHELRTLHPLEYRKILEERRRAVKPVMTTRDEVARSSDTQARP
jgi:cytochrome b subunit of formate dehydrogenase